jgi:hypothetical protein
VRQWLRSHLTYANVMATLAVFLVLGGGTAMAAYVITSNSQVAPNTISGHGGSAANKNIIAGSVNATDLANGAVTAAKIQGPEAWHQVGAGSTTQNLCADPSKTALFCTDLSPPVPEPWHNYGGGFATAGFYKDQLGIVHLKGLVVNVPLTGVDPQVRPIFRLPLAYAPAHQRVFPSVGRNTYGQEVAQGRVDVQPNGLVVLVSDCGEDPLSHNPDQCSASGGYVSLDAISFRRDG